ncbi:MAG: ATPase P [Chloroflexi bacterium]|nr:ATPase P [Chloroflexota bacterium]MDL1940941.1 cation-translocating P-type ATPase [Chloroflexi bacterium CFX2]
MTNSQTLEIPISGMDCAECTMHVQHAIEKLPGVQSVSVFLGSEKAVVKLDPAQVDVQTIRAAVQGAGYDVPASDSPKVDPVSMGSFNRRLTILLVGVFAIILGVVIFGEGLGLFDFLNDLIPFPLGIVFVMAGGYPVFMNVIRAALKRQVISHTLMTIGVLAALFVGQWVTAALVVVFMRIGDYVENFTTESARRAVKELTSLAPQTARVERDGMEMEVPVTEVKPGEIVVVRPGERIAVDGKVISGHATIDQSAITGESMPVEAASGMHVYAAATARLGSLRIRAERIGVDTTFGRVIKMVEEAEARRADVQQIADKFSAWYLPVVAVIAALTFLFTRNPLSTAAVLLVACSCSFALATPVAMLASVGAGAKRGLLIKGGKYLELLARADVLLVDKTGTLTLGQPRVTDVISLNGLPRSDLLRLAASAERYSEHPLAEAVRALAHEENVALLEPEKFEAIPGYGVQAIINSQTIRIGNRRMISSASSLPIAADLESQGKTLLFMEQNRELIGVFAAADTLRPEVPAALAEVRSLGIRHIELLTGDNERTASALAEKLGVSHRANLLPEHKIDVVRDFQAKGHTVVMIGDGVNDAPALAQADIGIAMGAAGTDVAIEAAHIALMREDWSLVPDVLKIAKRTMKVVKMNLAFTTIYNLAGLSLAAIGILPPVLAAAAQSLPDIGIMGNSARLLRHK